MAKIPKKPEEIFAEITDDYRQIFGDDLISIILYGSGAGEDYIPGKSDLNFLITLTDRGIERLDRVLETVARWRKRNVAIPLFMTRSYLTGSQDAYPIEFLNMKRHYVVVTGEDVLAPSSPSIRAISGSSSNGNSGESSSTSGAATSPRRETPERSAN